MPLLDILAKDLIDQTMLLDRRQALELLGDNVQRVHGATAAGDILHFELRGLEVFLEGVEDFALGSVEVLGRDDVGCF